VLLSALPLAAAQQEKEADAETIRQQREYARAHERGCACSSIATPRQADRQHPVRRPGARGGGAPQPVLANAAAPGGQHVRHEGREGRAAGGVRGAADLAADCYRRHPEAGGAHAHGSPVCPPCGLNAPAHRWRRRSCARRPCRPCPSTQPPSESKSPARCVRLMITSSLRASVTARTCVGHGAHSVGGAGGDVAGAAHGADAEPRGHA
jgi:hypothetical protein